MVISGRSKARKMRPNVRTKNYTREVCHLYTWSWASLHVKFFEQKSPSKSEGLLSVFFMYAKVRLPDVDALLFWQIHGVGFCDAVGFVPCVDVWHLAVHTPHAQLVWGVAAGLAWQSRSRFPLASSKQMNAASQSLRHFTKVGLSETSMANAYSLLSFKWFCLRH